MTIRLTCPTCSRTFSAKRGAIVTCECGERIRPSGNVTADREAAIMRAFEGLRMPIKLRCP